jgi:putative FmdB family regulatory protein
MPTYDYRCDACEHEFEEFQSIKADALKTCPKCGKDELRRLIGPGAALLFKGSGFYLTDYRSEGYKKAAKAEKESSGAKTESKGGDAGGKSAGSSTTGGASGSSSSGSSGAT